MGDTGEGAQGGVYVPPRSFRVIVSMSGSWSLFPLASHPHGAETQWLLGAEKELKWAGRRAWIALLSGNFCVEIYRDPGNQSPAKQSLFLWLSLEA